MDETVWYKLKFITFSVVLCGLAVTIFPAVTCSKTCGISTAFLIPPRSEFRGNYVNRVFEYSLVIPSGFTGYDAAGLANHHGVSIPVGEPPESAILVNGQANSLEYRTPEDLAHQIPQFMRQEGKHLITKKVMKSRLGELAAVQIVVRYRCPGSEKQYIQDYTIALSPHRETLYEITLESDTNSYDRGRSILGALLNSWRYIGP
jgi:hypothetical protein